MVELITSRKNMHGILPGGAMCATLQHLLMGGILNDPAFRQQPDACHVQGDIDVEKWRCANRHREDAEALDS